MELWSSGGALQATWRCRGMEIRALEARCTCRDVEEFASRALEIRCRRCLKRGVEHWSSSVLLSAPRPCICAKIAVQDGGKEMHPR